MGALAGRGGGKGGGGVAAATLDRAGQVPVGGGSDYRHAGSAGPLRPAPIAHADRGRRARDPAPRRGTRPPPPFRVGTAPDPWSQCRRRRSRDPSLRPPVLHRPAVAARPLTGAGPEDDVPARLVDRQPRRSPTSVALSAAEVERLDLIVAARREATGRYCSRSMVLREAIRV